jgi:hypothetical protein
MSNWTKGIDKAESNQKPGQNLKTSQITMLTVFNT